METMLDTIFKPEAKNVRGTFDGENYYQVPDYQRPYSWGDEQIDQLWDDIFSAYSEKQQSYFLGPVILTPSRGGYSEIIDGQQRLTTLTILFCVLRDLYYAKDNKVVNRIQSLEEGKFRLRMITQMNLQNHFEQIILNGVKFPAQKPTDTGDKFLNAAWMFREKLKPLSKAVVDGFLAFVLNSVVLITITCSSRSSAIQLFQVINTRGLDLSNADLIKSHLFGRLEGDLDKQKFVSTWTQIDEIASQMEYETMEDLFTYYEYYLLAKIPKRSLYEEIEAQMKGVDSNKAIYDFKKFVEFYHNVYDMQSKKVYSLWYLPNQVFWKSILATAKMVQYAEFEALVRLLRALYYTYWIAGFTSAKVRQLSFDIIGGLKNKKSIDDLRVLVKSKIAEDSARELVDRNIRGDAYDSKWFKPTLLSIEYEQTDASKLAFIDITRSLQSDHILPKAWQSKPQWRVIWNDKDAIEWLNRPGNLALLSGKKNSGASNDPFDKKKHVYNGKGIDGKTAFLTSQPISAEPQWSLAQVKQRQDWFQFELSKLLLV